MRRIIILETQRNQQQRKEKEGIPYYAVQYIRTTLGSEEIKLLWFDLQQNVQSEHRKHTRVEKVM